MENLNKSVAKRERDHEEKESKEACSLFEKQYRDILQRCLNNGEDKDSRGGPRQRSLFVEQMRTNLEDGFPLLTARKISFNIVAHEMLWKLKGLTNIRYLQENNVHIWDDFADENGEVGPMYQWRKWEHEGRSIDQLKNVINEIKENPSSKRLIVSSWNVGDLYENKAALPPCPHLFQFFVINGKINCHLSQRAGDLILGIPYDLAVYALLTHVVAQVTGLKPGEITHTITDCHIYHDHIAVAKEILQQKTGKLPILVLDKQVTDIDTISADDMEITGYKPAKTIRNIPVAMGPLRQTFFHNSE